MKDLSLTKPFVNIVWFFGGGGGGDGGVCVCVEGGVSLL
jgi:hypothetical protein